ncbi:MAG: S1C family serine protease [Gemmatimonadaceae bacterium]
MKATMSPVALALFASALFIIPTSVHGQSNRELSVADIVARSASAVVTIKAFDAAGRSIGLGSGFRVASGRVVTNAHVVAGAARVEVFDNNEQLLGTVGFAEAVSSTVDLAVLPRLGTRTAQLPMAVSLPKVGERVIVIGAPEGLTNTVSDGIVSAIRADQGRTLLQISAPISPGSSGGPVLNTSGEVVGVSVSILREGQNLNFAVPLPDIVAVLASPPGRVAFPAETRDVTNARDERRHTGNTPVAFHLGDSIEGALTDTDETIGDGRRFDQYSIRLARGEHVSVTARSSDFDAYLYVFRVVNDTLAIVTSDDDGGGGVDAEADFTAPAAAEYVVTVISATTKDIFGKYTVSARRDAKGATTRGSSSDASGDTERWIAIGSSETTAFAYDRTRITPVGNGTYRMWLRKTWETPFTDSMGDTYNLVYTWQEVDCRQSRIRAVELTQYLDQKLVYSSPTQNPGPWSTVTPESIGEMEVQTFCRYVVSRGL